MQKYLRMEIGLTFECRVNVLEVVPLSDKSLNTLKPKLSWNEYLFTLERNVSPHMEMAPEFVYESIDNEEVKVND